MADVRISVSHYPRDSAFAVIELLTARARDWYVDKVNDSALIVHTYTIDLPESGRILRKMVRDGLSVEGSDEDMYALGVKRR